MSRILLYATEDEGTGARVERVIEGLVSPQELEVHRTIESLILRLQRPRESLRIIALVPASQQDFLAILSLRDLLQDYRTIVCLPAESGVSMAEGLSLYPRYLAPDDFHPRDLAAVLNRMLSLYATDSWGLNGGRPAGSGR